MPETTLENPVLQDTEADKLLEMAHQFDATGEYEEPEIHDKPPETTPQKPPEKSSEETAKGRDEKGRFTPKETKEGEPSKPEEIKPPEKPAEQQESAYTKAQKEQARKDKTWQQIESEKQAVRRERAELQQRQQQIEAERARFIQSNMPRATKDGFSAPDYAKAAEDFARNGDFENAFKAEKTVQDLLAYEQRYYAEQNQKQQQTILEQTFQADLQKAISIDADADPNSGSQLSKEMKTLFDEHPYMTFLPEAPLRAMEIAKMRIGMVELGEARKRIEELEAEKAQRDKASQPIRPGPTQPGQARSFDDLTPQEMEAELERASSEADDIYGR
jgi:hypothetical protein